MGRKSRKVKKRTVPLSQLERLYIRDGGCCWVCGESGTIAEFNRDHLIPKSLGGSDGMWNIRMTHPTCNSERNRVPPPIEMVLQYCNDPGSIGRAKRMYYKAYPHLKPGCIGKPESPRPVIIQGRKRGRLTLASVTPAPPGHKRHPSAACSLCNSWCGTCRACWCMAYENDHDALKIRRPNVAMGVTTPS